jgi:hypothetical protein
MPAVPGGLHDRFDGYAIAMALLCGLLVVASALVLLSGRLR